MSGFTVFENEKCSAVWNILLEEIWKHIVRMMAKPEKQLEVHRSLYESNKSKELLFPLTSLLLFLLSCCRIWSCQGAYYSQRSEFQSHCPLHLISSPVRREDRVGGTGLMISQPHTLCTSAKLPHWGFISAKYQRLFVKISGCLWSEVRIKREILKGQYLNSPNTIVNRKMV